MERINKLLIILSVGIVLLISINACSSHFPGESDMVGQWVADSNAVLVFNKDSSFTLSGLDSRCWLSEDDVYYSDSILINGEGKWSLRKRSSKEIALTLFFEKMSVMNKLTAMEKEIKPNNYTVSIQGTTKIMLYTPSWTIYISDGEELNSYRFYKIAEK